MAANTKQDKRQTKTDLSYLPQKLNDRLMPFQREGVKFGISKNGRCLIADEMGLGKTLQALAVALYFKSEWPLLIVVPASLRYPWIEEVEKWIPDIHPHDINLIQGGADVEDIPTSLITVVTYGLLRHPSSKIVQEALYNQQYKVVIVDESHYIKNRKTASTKYMVPLLQRAWRKILLTGTPALARPEELYPQLDSILPGKFGSWSAYAKQYCDAQYRWYGRRKQWVTDGASNLQELQRLLSERVMIRRLKQNVLTQLPPKQRQRIAFQLKESTLKKDLDTTWDSLSEALGHKKKLNQILSGDLKDSASSSDEVNKSSATATDLGGGPGPGMSQHNADTAPDPLQVFEPTKAPGNSVFGLLSQLYRKTCAAKIGPVKDYLKMLYQNEGLKFIVFAHHHIMMDSLAEQLSDEGVRYIRIDGNTFMQDRPRLVHEFQADPKIRCALLSIKAAGVGLTLTAAKLVVFAELDWTPGVLQQCEDRAHRIGQTGVVHVHYLVAKNTLDEWVWGALCKKTTVVTTTLNGQTQVLEMDQGNDGQMEILEDADAYIPQKRDDQNLSCFLQSQPVNQKTMFDFFTPRGSKKTKKSDPGESSPTTSKSKSRMREKRAVPKSSEIVLIDTDHEDEFCSPNTENRAKRKRQQQTASDSFLNDSVGTEQASTQNSNDAGNDQEEVILPCDLDEIPTPRVKRRRTRNVCESEPVQPKETAMQDMEKTPGKAKPQNDPNTWSCSGCTYINHNALPYCEICSTPKSKKAKSIDSSQPKNCAKKLNDPQGMSQGSSSVVSVGSRRSPSLFSEAADSSQNDPQQGFSCEDVSQHVSENGLHINNVESVEVVPESDLEDDTDALDVSGANIMDYSDASDSPKSPDIQFDSAVDSEVGANSEGDIKDFNSVTSEDKNTGLDSPPRQTNMEDVISQETEAVKLLFSPGFKRASRLAKRPWLCPDCQVTNEVGAEDCDGCLASRPEDISLIENTQKDEEVPSAASETQPKKRVVDLDSVPVYSLFKFCCSKNTSRIYLYDQDDKPLQANFTALDVELDNFADLPDIILRPENLRLVQRFVREWNSLALTKRRLIVKSGQIFSSPSLVYDDLKAGKTRVTQRYTTKVDTASAAITKAEEIGGSLRVINRPQIPAKKSRGRGGKRGVDWENEEPQTTGEGKTAGGSGENKEATAAGSSVSASGTEGKPTSDAGLTLAEVEEKMKGIVQAVSEDGTPLCVHCQRPYHCQLISDRTVRENPWQTRFCSRLCMDKHWMRSHRSYTVDAVYREEHGVCQICSLDAQGLFSRIKNTTDLTKRAKLIQESKYGVLKTETKQKMARNPQKGMFWQVDHIVAVVEGGGMCDIDNLRTLCVPCHRDVTADLLRDRARQRQRAAAAKCGDITAFFSAK